MIRSNKGNIYDGKMKKENSQKRQIRTMLLLLDFHLGAVNNFGNCLWKKNVIMIIFLKELLCPVDELGDECISQPLLVIMSSEILPYKLKNVHD